MSFPAVGPAFRAQILRRDPGAAAWFEDLPGLWSRLSRSWDLTMTGAIRSGMTSMVVPVEISPSGQRAALKLISPIASADDEAAALTAFDWRGAVGLLDADSEAQALLLEWLEGPPLSEMTDRSQAIHIAGGVASELATAPAPAGTPTLAAQAPGWHAQLLQQHQRAEQSGTALADRHVHLAAEMISQQTAGHAEGLTHGDLSLINILHADRGWVAIDPLLLSGPATIEAHTVVRSHLGSIDGADDPAKLLAHWTRQFTGAAGLDYAHAWGLSFARFVSSYYWESQHHGAPDDVERLRRAATAIAATIEGLTPGG